MARSSFLKAAFQKARQMFRTVSGAIDTYILRQPWFATCITLLVIVTGLLGSIYSTEIKNALPFPFYWRNQPWSQEAFRFWILALVASLCYFLRETAVTREQQKLQDETLEQAAEFERLIRTLPPKNFLTNFSELYGAADAVLNATRSGPQPKSPELIQESIRWILLIIATLAQNFDGDNSDVLYSANIMLFRPVDQIPPEEHGAIRERLVFSDENVGVESLLGILDLQTALSTTHQSESAAIDPDLRPLALTIPRTSKVGGRFRVLPGAPLAFVERRPDLYADTTHLAQWCESNCDFTREIITQLSTFFEDSPVKGFASIPLFMIEEDGSDAKDQPPFGILNVHCNRAGLLAQGESLAHFADITRPFRMMLMKLLLILPSAHTLQQDQTNQIAETDI